MREVTVNLLSKVIFVLLCTIHFVLHNRNICVHKRVRNIRIAKDKMFTYGFKQLYNLYHFFTLHIGRLINFCWWLDVFLIIFKLWRFRVDFYLFIVVFRDKGPVYVNRHTWAITGTGDKKKEWRKKKSVVSSRLSEYHRSRKTELGPMV